MKVRIRTPTIQELWLTRAEVMWQPVETKKNQWYPVYYGNINHTDVETRRDVLNAAYLGLTVTCRASYDRTTHKLTILEGGEKA